MRNTSKGILALILTSAMFASMGIFARIMQTGFALFEQTYLRIGLAFLLGILFFNSSIRFKKIRSIPLKDWVLLIIRAFSNYIGGVILYTLAVFNTTLGNVSLIQALPLVALLGVLFLQEKLTKAKIFFLLLSFIGVAFISTTNISDIFVWGKGETLSFIAAFFFSFGYVSRRWQTNYLNNKEMTQIMLLIAAVFLLIGSFIFHENLPITGWSWPIVFALGISAIFNVLVLFLINYGFEHVKPFLASNILTLEAFFAIILGFLIYKEVPMMKDIVGGILIIISVVGMNYIEEAK